MAKKTNAVYEPGELSRVRGKLGNIDEAEAKRMAQILGGEVGTEKTVDMTLPGQQQRMRPKRAVEVAGSDDDIAFSFSGKHGAFEAPKKDPSDDPSIHLRTSYFERVKMDRYSAQFEFEIKNSAQVLVSMFSFFSDPADYVNPRFISGRMSVYFNKIEQLVSTTRTLLPRNNAVRSERLKKASPFVFSVLDTIRYWNIERIDADLAKIQSHPRSVRVFELADILKAVYKPLFILEKLNMDTHIKGSYMLLLKLLHIENPVEAMEKNQAIARTALAAFADIRREVHFGLYPLLMKFISDRWFPYKQLFSARHHRLMAFLGVTENDQIKMVDFTPEQVETGNLEAVKEEVAQETKDQEEKDQNGEKEVQPDDPKTAEQKARKLAEEAEQKALNHSLSVLESLFPKAGWDKLSEFPDMYPYFSSIYSLRRGYDLIAPTDPLIQVAVLMHIMEDICASLHYITYGLVTAPDGTHLHMQGAMADIITNWQRYLDESFNKEYLPRLTEYCHMLEHSTDSRATVYAKRTLNELRWTKRLYFLPYYKFESLGPPPFQNSDTTPIYSQVRNLRRNLTMIAGGIEQGTRRGGAEAKVPCAGIENPWAPYNFEIPNPVSKRMGALIGAGKRNNAAVIFFALSVSIVLDYLLNNEASWAYNDNGGILFRSLNGEGVTPMFGVTDKVDADQIFRDTLRRREAKQ